MPYRDQPTVQSWVTDFWNERGGVAPEIVVLDQYYETGPDSSLVIVRLRTASTSTYIEPLREDGVPRWKVTFEAREDAIHLDAAGVAKLSADLKTLAELCEFLQARTDAALLAAQ